MLSAAQLDTLARSERSAYGLATYDGFLSKVKDAILKILRMRLGSALLVLVMGSSISTLVVRPHTGDLKYILLTLIYSILLLLCLTIVVLSRTAISWTSNKPLRLSYYALISANVLAFLYGVAGLLLL